MRNIKFVSSIDDETFEPTIYVEVDGKITNICSRLEAVQDCMGFHGKEVAEKLETELLKLLMDELIVQFDPTADEIILWEVYIKANANMRN